MGIKRGTWKPGTFDKTADIGPKRIKPANILVSGQSNSETLLKDRDLQQVSGNGLNAVSDHRKEEILIRGTQASNQSDIATPLIVYSNSYKKTQEIRKQYGMDKTAATVNVSNSGTNVVRQAPEVYSPLFQIANLQLPRDRVTMNAWNRNFFDTHPLVRNCINLHATYPLGKINIRCKDKKIEQFFQDMIQEMDLLGILQNIAQEFYKIGECFPYADLDGDKGIWKDINILNPDYVHVKKSVLGGDPVIALRPDAVLQRLVMSNNPADIQLRKQISPEIVHHVRKGNNIPLDNFHVSHLKMTSSPYDIRGTSMIVSIYKDCMLYDKLRESKFAQADNLVNPITLVSVGGNADGEYRATDADLENWRQTFESAQYDRDFKIISHAGVKIERIGASGSIIDISGDMNFIIDNILYGLMTPKAILTQEGASYSSASIGLEVLKQRYEAFRNMLSKWLVMKIFAPISEIHDFYEYSDGNKKLVVPEVDWNQMILFDMDNYIQALNQLHQKDPQTGARSVSKETVFKSLGLDVEEERQRIRSEMIQEEIFIKEQQIAKQMTLSALRALKDDEDIIEPTQEALPGTPGYVEEAAGVPGAMPMDLGMGMGLPPLPTGGAGMGAGVAPAIPELGPAAPGAGGAAPTGGGGAGGAGGAGGGAGV
jgi:hypothetical protein